MRVYHSREIGKWLGCSHETARKYCKKAKFTLPLSKEELQKLITYYQNEKISRTLKYQGNP